MNKRIRFVVKGKVQQVGFRYFCQREAIVLNLTGFAKNLPDGSVLVEAQGEESAIEKFRPIVARGPRDSVVSSCIESWIDTHSNDMGFSVGWES